MSDSEKVDQQPQQKERRKIEIKFIQDKTRRHITFSKRKHGIMKKAYELSVLTGTQVLLLVVSETGLVYTFTTPKFQPIVTQPEGKNLIQACLNAPDEDEDDIKDQKNEGTAGTSTISQAGIPVQTLQNQHLQHPHVQLPQMSGQSSINHPQQTHPQNFGNPAAYLNPEQAAVYQQYFNGVSSQPGQF